SLVIAAILLVATSWAQGKNISGTVTDNTGQPLPGVAVVVDETTIGTVTNADGKYTLNVPADAKKLTFSFVGMKKVTVQIKNKTVIDLSMEPETIGLEEVIAIGYGTQKKVNITGAVATVESEELEKINTVNSTQLLQGQMAGVITKQTSGMPGADNATISIRGFGNPLVLVDGDERQLSSIDPDVIESVSVLKDASAAIYGARSGNGVILITTKRGKFQEDLSITYNGAYSIQQFTHKPSIIKDAGTYMQFQTEAELYSGLTPTFSEEEIQKYTEGGPGYESYDWFDYAFKNWTPQQKHNISLRGGGKNVSFFTSLGAVDQQGVIASDDFWYKRYNVRSNIDGNITDDLSFVFDMNYINEHRSAAELVDGGVWRGVYKSQPMARTSFPEPYSDLTPSSNLKGTHQRLVGKMNKDIKGGTDWYPETFNGEFELNYKFPFVKGLSTSLSLDYLVTNTRRKQFARQFELYKWDPEIGEPVPDGKFPATFVNNMVEIRQTKFTRFKPKAEIRFDRDFGKHSVNALVLGEFFNDNTNWIQAHTENLLSNKLMYLNFGDKTYHELDQSVVEATRASIAGRLNYGYAGKYLLEGTFRYDASSIFPPDGRWGFFPSVSAGWRISEEPFMDNVTWLDNLKLRASYSETGFDRNAIRYDYFAGYNVFTNPLYLMGSEAYRRIEVGTLPNFGMTWEKMTNYNLGIDMNMWDGLFNIVAEGFYRKRTDILATPQQSFPSTFGASISKRNLNSMDDRGIDLELSHNNKIGALSYRIKGTFTYARSKWINYEEEEYTTEDEIRIFQNSGKWQNQRIGYVSDGLFRSQEEIDNYPVDQDQAGNVTLIPGDIKYIDLNDDGIINWADQKVIGYGTGQPDLNFGLNLGGTYKGFSLDILLHGGSMFSGYISGLAQTPFNNESTPLEIHWKERFHPENNPDGSLPSVTMGTRSNNTKNSDFWLRSITFLRLKNVNLGYNLPKKLIDPIGFDRVRAYITSSNLYVISNLGIWSSEFDPESPLNESQYPPHRTITFGLTITL
ncbi:MAG: TonB-dependent receptor, partial [Prolixibacteraceae bacterium]|nr:TonB-dependent receptor [Prolixibacteraceae bacterium]